MYLKRRRRTSKGAQTALARGRGLAVSLSAEGLSTYDMGPLSLACVGSVFGWAGSYNTVATWPSHNSGSATVRPSEIQRIMMCR